MDGNRKSRGIKLPTFLLHLLSFVVIQQRSFEIILKN